MDNDFILQELDGTSHGGSRLTSWANTSGNTTMVREEAPSKTRPAIVFDATTTPLVRNLSIPSRKSSAAAMAKSSVDSKRVYSALMKRMSESESNRECYSSHPIYEAPPESPADESDLPPIQESPVKSGSETVRIVPRGKSSRDDFLPANLQKYTHHQGRVVSPSVYSPYPWTNMHEAQSSSPSINEVGPRSAGTAFVSPSQPIATWRYHIATPCDSDDRPLTSGEWRNWASSQMSELDKLNSQPPSMRFRGSIDAISDHRSAPDAYIRASLRDENIMHEYQEDTAALHSPPQETLQPPQHHTHEYKLSSRQLSHVSPVPQRTSSSHILNAEAHHHAIPPRTTSSTALAQLPKSKAFAFATRPTFAQRISSGNLAPLVERNSVSSENVPPRAETPEWVHAPRRDDSPSKSPLSERLLNDIRRGPYAESVSSSSAKSTPRRSKAPDLAELRVRRTRRRKGLGGDGGVMDRGRLVDEFLRSRTGVGGAGAGDDGEEGAFL